VSRIIDALDVMYLDTIVDAYELLRELLHMYTACIRIEGVGVQERLKMRCDF